MREPRKQVSVILADVKGSMDLTERMPSVVKTSLTTVVSRPLVGRVEEDSQLTGTAGGNAAGERSFTEILHRARARAR
jgi:hypothetical protein